MRLYHFSLERKPFAEADWTTCMTLLGTCLERSGVAESSSRTLCWIDRYVEWIFVQNSSRHEIWNTWFKKVSCLPAPLSIQPWCQIVWTNPSRKDVGSAWSSVSELTFARHFHRTEIRVRDEVGCGRAWKWFCSSSFRVISNIYGHPSLAKGAANHN